MGKEAQCTARWRGRETTGQARLEADDLRFRGDKLDVTILFRDLGQVQVKEGVLSLIAPEGILELDLGKSAQSWASAIENPPTRLDKLGIKAGTRVRVVGDLPDDFLAELAAAGVKQADEGFSVDVALLAIANDKSLNRLAELRELVRPAGAIWAVWRKGFKALSEDHVRAAALAQGLVDVKVARFDKSLSALKLVIRKGNR